MFDTLYMGREKDLLIDEQRTRYLSDLARARELLEEVQRGSVTVRHDVSVSLAALSLSIDRLVTFEALTTAEQAFDDSMNSGTWDELNKAAETAHELAMLDIDSTGDERLDQLQSVEYLLAGYIDCLTGDESADEVSWSADEQELRRAAVIERATRMHTLRVEGEIGLERHLGLDPAQL